MLLKSLALATWLLLGTTAHAHAIPLVGAVVGLFGIGVAAQIVTGVLTLALGIGLQVLSSLLLRKRPADSQVGGTTGKAQASGVVPRSFPIGRTVVSHSYVYRNSFGQDGKTPNAYVVEVYALADLPVTGLAEIWVNGSRVTWNPEATPGTEGIAIPEYVKDGKDHLWIRFYDGTQVAADSRLVSLFSGDADRPYPSTRVGLGVAYAVVTFRFERELFGGFPQFKFVLDGIPLYDLREDDTNGGSGDQRWNTPEEWTVSSNPAVAAYNIIRGIRYDGEWFFGGQTVSSLQVPAASWAAAMNECDIPVALADTGSPPETEPQFTANGEVRLDMQPSDVVTMLLNACNGRAAEIGGIYKMHAGAAGSAVFSITDDDILSTEPQTFEPFKTLAEQVNSVTGKYIEPGEGWAAKDAPPLINEDMEAIDGGRRQIADVPYDFVTSGTTVQRLMRAALYEHRRERTHTLPLPPEAYVLEPTVDFISWTSDRNGYLNKLFRVDAVQDPENLDILVSLTEVDPSDYDWNAATDEQPIVIAPTPLVFPPVQGIDDVDIEGVVIQGAGERAKAGARLIWDGEDQDDVRAVAFQIRVDGETDPIYQGETSENAVAEGEYIVSANLSPATDYEGRLKFVPHSGRLTSWSDWIEFTTPDVRVSYSELSERLDAANRLFNERIQGLSSRLDDLGGAVASIESVTTGTDQFLVERANRITASLGGAKASITETQIVQATVVNALAALGIDVEAALGTDSAAGFLRIIASVDGGGALAALLFGVSTTENGVTEDAAFKMIASGGQSLIQLVADQTQILDENGDPFATFDGTDATLYIDRIRRFTASQFQQLKSTDSTVRSISSGMSWLNIWSTSFDLEQDGDTLFLYSYNLTPVTGPGYICDIRVKVDGNVYEQRRLANFQQGFWFAEAMDAGSHSFDVEFGNCSSGSGTSSFHPQILLLPNSTK
jgi:hypothetical protein